MIGTRAPEDPYTLRFESTVESVTEDAENEGTTVALSETYFYAESGGQPPDRGTLGGCAVLDVQERDGEVVPTLADTLDASEGDTLVGEIDPAFRTYCMRAHTASHVLYGAGRRLLDEVGYGGFDIGTEKVRVDFETTTEISSDLLVELERLVNRTVWDSRDVSWDEYPREDALAREDVAFNTKTEEGLGDESVRIVEIDGWDVAACGGTHVRNTSEIGPVTVLERSNPGEGRTRVEFAVGPTAIRERADERKAALDAATVANTRVSDLPSVVTDLRADRDAIAEKRDALCERVVETRIAELREDAIEKGGKQWVVGTIDGFDANALADRAGAIDRSSGGGADEWTPAVVALVDSEGGYLAVASDGQTDANGVIERVTSEFGGGGGGSSSVAQAGGFDADSEELVSFLRGEHE